MKKDLYKKLESLDEMIDAVYQGLAGLSEEQLHDHSYGWSVIEVLAHLQLAEELSLTYMQKKLQAGDNMKDASALSKIKLRLGKYVMKSSLKWKAPKVVASPNGDLSFGELKDKWLATRRLLKMFIDDYPDAYLKKEVYKHPLAGRLTARCPATVSKQGLRLQPLMSVLS